MPARLNASLYASDRPASRLQCSVERIWSARGSSRAEPSSPPSPVGDAIAWSSGRPSAAPTGMDSCMPIPPLRVDESLEHGLVQVAVGREERAAVDPAAALEVRHAAAGLLDEDRRAPPRPMARGRPRPSPPPHPRRAARSPRSPRSRARARRRGAGRRSPAPGPTPRCRGPIRTGPGRRRAPSRPTRGCAAASSPRFRAHAPPPRCAHQRSSRAGADRHAGLELAVALDREERPEQRHAADVVVGAVDRVDVPADRRVARLRCRTPRRPGRGPGRRRPGARGSAARSPCRPG